MAPLLSRLGVGNGGFGFGRSGSATPSAPLEEAFEIFLLAGGGGGAGTPAGYAGGGGGSGGAVYFSEYKINSTRTLSITVGGGGAAGSGGGRAPNGTPSTVTDPTGPYVITADGGGGGNGYSPYQIGASGGSGGGSETPGGDYPGAIGTQGKLPVSVNKNFYINDGIKTKALNILGFGVSKYFYTSLMQLYVGEQNPEMAYKILQEMIERGIQPDLPVYTTLINAFRQGRKLEKCW